MDWNLLGIALLLTLAGFYLLEAELSKAPMRDLHGRALGPARTPLERAWLAEPLQVFMRQLFAARQQRADHWRWHPGRL